MPSHTGDPPPRPHHATSSAERVLEALPHGVLTLDAGGEILEANATARRMIEDLSTPLVQRCHDLFACRSSGAPCEHGCLVQRAARAEDALPEVRIDTPGGSTPGAFWVSAAPLSGGGAGRAILHLRSGERGDRRRRSHGRWLTGPELRIWTFGTTHVEALDDSLDGHWLRQRPGQVLKYLVVNRDGVVLVDEIADSIWPESGRHTVSNARYVIHQLREKLEPRRQAHDSPAFVVARSGGYALDRDRVWIDVDEFESAVENGRAAMARMDSAAAQHHLEHAIELYRGDFLADDPYMEWAVDERHRLAGLATYALRVATALAHERADTEAAVRHLDRLAELEPFDSAVHRELIAALLRGGLRSDAKRRYDRFAERLRREFGEEADFDLSSLAGSAGQRPG